MEREVNRAVPRSIEVIGGMRKRREKGYATTLFQSRQLRHHSLDWI